MHNGQIFSIVVTTCMANVLYVPKIYFLFISTCRAIELSPIYDLVVLSFCISWGGLDLAVLCTPWVKVFRIILEFRILRLTFHRKSASKC